MDSNITIHIVEPGSTPVDPVVPNTGLFTSGGIGGAETAIIATVSLVAILAIIIAVLYYRNKKQGKFISLKHKKSTAIGLASLAAVVSLGTVAGLLKLGASAADDGLTVTSSSEELTIELADEPVFAVLPVELTIAEATQAGYTLTAYTEDTNLISTADESKVIPMVAADEGELTTLTDNTYGLSLVEPEDKDSEVYAPLSTDSTNSTFITDKDYKATEANDTTTIYYGFYITPDTPYGTYTGSNINYEADPNYITTLSFNGNGSDGGVDMEGMTLLAGDTITLPQNTYTKEGYSFTGWNTVATPTTEDPGIAYEDEADFTASLTQSEDITLYAQWKKILYMQDVATWGNTLREGDTIEAVDNRDGKTYYVSRLADGNIWMTQNLDLDLSTSTELTPANTNISSNWTPANSTLAFTGTTVEGWQDNNNVPYSADPGELYTHSSGDTYQDDQYTSLADCQAAHPDCSMHNHVGNYYNWPAAVASNDTSSLTTRYSNAPSSICPAGWRLPTGRDSNNTAASREWNAVLYAEGVASSATGDGYTTNGFNKILTTPLWLARSHRISNGTLSDIGTDGYYWSSTVSFSTGAYALFFYAYDLRSSEADGRDFGFSVRCIAQ